MSTSMLLPQSRTSSTWRARVYGGIDEISRLSFFAPAYVLTNLFVCVLQKPTHDCVTLALSLMDLGAAFFTRLHVATESQVPMEFAKELTAIARETAQTSSVTGPSSTQELGGGAEFFEHDIPTAGNEYDDSGISFAVQDQISQDALAIEQWSILIPVDIDLDGIDLQTLSNA